MVSGRDEGRHLSQHAAAESLAKHRKPSALVIVQPQSSATQLRLQHAVLFAQEGDHLALLTLKYSKQRPSSITSESTRRVYANGQPPSFRTQRLLAASDTPAFPLACAVAVALAFLRLASIHCHGHQDHHTDGYSKERDVVGRYQRASHRTLNQSDRTLPNRCHGHALKCNPIFLRVSFLGGSSMLSDPPAC